MNIVEHQVQENCFVVSCDGAEAVLKYSLSQQNAAGIVTIDFTSTFVPPELRGKGLAENLVRTAIEWAKSQGYELTASCWYVAKFIR